MKTKIESVRVYTIYLKKTNKTRIEFEVEYKTGRWFKFDEENAPLTVINFIMTAQKNEWISTKEDEVKTVKIERYKEG